MLLNSANLDDLFKLAISAVKEAGQMIREYDSQSLSIQSKKGGNQLASQVVTEVDLRSEAIILKILKPSCILYDLALLSEERKDDKLRLKKDYFWCVDPLDGTLPFIESTPGYSVSIALVSRLGEALIGVVYDPLQDILYAASKGRGAFRNEDPWRLSLPQDKAKKSLTFICDRSFLQHDEYPEVVKALEKMIGHKKPGAIEVLHQGGAAMNACWVIEKDPACYFKFPKPQEGGGSLWDFAATSCIFNEFGAFARDIHGQPLDLNRPDSTFMNHRGVIFAANPFWIAQITSLYIELTQ